MFTFVSIPLIDGQMFEAIVYSTPTFVAVAVIVKGAGSNVMLYRNSGI